MYEVWCKYAKKTAYYSHVTLVLKYFKQFHECLDAKGPDGYHWTFLPDHVVAKLRGAIDKIHLHYQWLHVAAKNNDPPLYLWKETSKFHVLWHIGDQSQYLSPTVSWTYGGEDFVGIMSDIGLAERHGIQPAKRSETIVM
eukprot:2483447-Pyramimonas_sp.AAC.1